LIKKKQERSSGSLHPLVSERFVKRDQGPYVEPCPEGLMSVQVKELEKALQHNIKHAQHEGQAIKVLRSTRRGLSDSLIA
jgi:DNA-binding HxlR family transcriptional regulator